MKNIYSSLSTIIIILISTSSTIFAQNQQPTDYTKTNVSFPAEEDLGSVRISISAGYGRRIASGAENVSTAESDFTDGLRGGLDISGSISYVGKKNLGVGLLISSLSTSNDGNIPFNDGVTNFNLKASGKDKILFVGPAFFVRFPGKGVSFNMLMSLGYHGYSSEIRLSNSQISVSALGEGSTVGFGFDGSLDIKLAQNVHLGFGLNAFTGAVSELDITVNGKKETQKLSEKENLIRLGVNTGLRFTF